MVLELVYEKVAKTRKISLHHLYPVTKRHSKFDIPIMEKCDVSLTILAFAISCSSNGFLELRKIFKSLKRSCVKIPFLDKFCGLRVVGFSCKSNLLNI